MPTTRRKTSVKPTTAGVRWKYYPQSERCPDHLVAITKAFETVFKDIDSSQFDTNETRNESDAVTRIVRPHLEALNFRVERDKTQPGERLEMPALFEENGRPKKNYHVDAYNEETKTLVEIESGRAVTNNQWLKDLFEACLIVDVEFVVIAVRQIYKRSKDYEAVLKVMDAFDASRRIQLPLEGVLIIGY